MLQRIASPCTSTHDLRGSLTQRRLEFLLNKCQCNTVTRETMPSFYMLTLQVIICDTSYHYKTDASSRQQIPCNHSKRCSSKTGGRKTHEFRRKKKLSDRKWWFIPCIVFGKFKQNLHVYIGWRWQFFHSYLFQLFWPPRCRARKYKYFAALRSKSFS